MRGLYARARGRGADDDCHPHCPDGRGRRKVAANSNYPCKADFRAQRLQVAQLRSAHRQAARSVGVVDDIQGLQLSLRLHIETRERLENQLKEAHTAFIDTFLTLPESRYLLSLHSLGVTTAAIILAKIGNPNHCRNGQQLIKLAGTQPVPIAKASTRPAQKY